MAQMNKRVLLNSRPSGWVTPENFAFDEQPIPSPSAGEILIRNVVMSVDPYMRGRMNDTKSYIPPFQIGQPLQAGMVGEVVESENPQFHSGDYVTGMLNWETYSLSDGEGLSKVDKSLAPLSYHLGILGMPGATAYVGLTEIAECKEGEAVLVSAASGAVGTVVVQIAKNMECYVVGSAGSDAKCDYVKSLGADQVINYKTTESIHKSVADAFPAGIDVYFENVGGAMLEAAIWNLAFKARIALCGLIADYNVKPSEMQPGPRGLANMIGRSARMQGFIVSNYPSLASDWVQLGSRWLAEGKLQYRETVAEGIEKAPEAFIGMLKGENFGKQIVRLDDD